MAEVPAVTGDSSSSLVLLSSMVHIILAISSPYLVSFSFLVFPVILLFFFPC